MTLLAVASFVAVLLPGVSLPAYSAWSLARKRRIRSENLPWRSFLLGAALLIVPLISHLDWQAVVQQTIQLGLGFAVIAGFASLRAVLHSRPRQIAIGIVFATSVMASVSLLQLIPTLTNFTLEWLPHWTGGRAIGWLEHPNLWGLAAVIPAVFLLALPGQFPIALFNIIPTSIIVLASGSRTSAALLVVVLLGLVLTSKNRQPARVLLISFTALALPAAYLLFNNAWFIRFNPLPHLGASTNLLLSSEDLEFGAWSPLQVRLDSDRWGVLLGSMKREWTIVKTGDAWWARAKQSVTLVPGERYSWRSEIRSSSPDSIVGVHGIGQGEDYIFINASRDGGEWSLRAEGAVEAASLSVSSLRSSWDLVEISFRYQGKNSIGFHIGPTPDQRRFRSSASIDVRGMQLYSGDERAEYSPTFPSGMDKRASLGTVRGRAFYSSAAIVGWLEKPLFGWGGGAFEQYLQAREQDARRVVAHAHNLFTHTLFERGATGFIGLLILLGALLKFAASSRVSFILLVAVLFANLVDYTFWTSSVFYPLMTVLSLSSRNTMVGK